MDRPASLLYFDLDGFKPINDRFGHAEGDHALVAFASPSRSTTGPVNGIALEPLIGNTDE